MVSRPPRPLTRPSAQTPLVRLPKIFTRGDKRWRQELRRSRTSGSQGCRLPCINGATPTGRTLPRAWHRPCHLSRSRRSRREPIAQRAKKARREQCSRLICGAGGTGSRRASTATRSSGATDAHDSRGTPAGRRVTNRAPRPGPSLSAVTFPPCDSTRCRTIASPTPTPRYGRVVEPSA